MRHGTMWARSSCQRSRTGTFISPLPLGRWNSEKKGILKKDKDMGQESCSIDTHVHKKAPDLVSRTYKPEGTIVDVGGVPVGGTQVVVMAGPCAVESAEQLEQTARKVRAGGASILRGGAFKPRTSPYSFQGLGIQGLEMLALARESTGLPVVSEVMDTRQVETVARYADMLQIGSRNMQNFPLLKEAGNSHMPILLKRGMMATIEEYLYAAEYVLSRGNPTSSCVRGAYGPLKLLPAIPWT